MSTTKYILDTNVYIAAHEGYYNPDFAPSYWDILMKLGKDKVIESPKQVRDEISDANTWLSNWKKRSDIFLSSDLPNVIDFFREAIEAFKAVKKEHIEEIKKTKPNFRPSKDEVLSDADLYVVAGVLFYKQNFPEQEFVVVTKENREVRTYKLARIPHICDHLGIRCIDDFEFIKEVGIKFSAELS